MPPVAHDTVDDRKLIQSAYRKLLKSIKVKIDESDRKNIRKAYEIAVEAHHEQRRKSGEPYILHPIEVARICAEEIGLGPTAIVAALLHDVVEDTSVTLDDIHERFGDKIANIVDGLTKLKRDFNPTTAQAENFKKVLSTLVYDVRVVLIKMADRVHNMRTIGAMPKHKQLRIAAETSYIYAPLAHRLGLYNLKTEFQDLCMKITERDQYDEIARKLQETKRQRNAYINEFIDPLREKLDELKIKYRIHGRPKSISSIYNKIKKKNVPFEEIYDLFAVRIIIDISREKEKPICWQVYSIVTDVHTPIPERLKDWITTPKSNGYESLHTTVIGPKGRYVEVQIRSERMDEIAERGFAAHWKYKQIKNQQDLYDAWLDNIRDLMEDVDKDALEFVSDFKSNLFSEEVFVYTPKGDMKILPKGATALDFAFSIHTDVGYHCTAIKVNNRLVPMGYELESGDQVHVTTSKNQRPNEDWLKMVVTGRARSKIKSALREDLRRLADMGKEMLERKLSHMKLDLELNADNIAKHYGFKNRTDLFATIYNGYINLSDLREYKTEHGRILFDVPKHRKIEAEPVEEPVIKRSRKPRATSKNLITINGEPGEQYDYSFATCCNPVMGDDIFAFVGTNSGVKVHRTACPNAENMMTNFGYRTLNAEWASQASTEFVANLVITGIDDGPGVIERVTGEISSKLGMNIRSFSMAGDEGYYEGKISLVVANTNQLNLAIRALKSLKGVSTVIRTDHNDEE
ncbi:MAG: bifunctional (p)ppGpp synthetase/guanosine-3',5'-bis(diphosphate) 3'-pyrophosphohydrolase [Saprospiraceae bacterium]|nr:bifunctional (p)ppGpp synthetase/guanosine-3',5'-bis(diphosphate) 3'-pyrophosphohydrolase [Saprospiraceae bacterium]